MTVLQMQCTRFQSCQHLL